MPSLEAVKKHAGELTRYGIFYIEFHILEKTIHFLNTKCLFVNSDHVLCSLMKIKIFDTPFFLIFISQDIKIKKMVEPKFFFVTGDSVILSEPTLATERRSFCVIDGWHRVTALTELSKEFPNDPSYKMFPVVRVLENSDKINIYVAAAAINHMNAATAEMTYLDQITYARKLYAHWLANVHKQHPNKKPGYAAFARYIMAEKGDVFSEKSEAGINSIY